MQRLPWNADRNKGLSATVSARALKVDGRSLEIFFHHDGISSQRIGGSAGPPAVGSTMSMVDVGAMLYRGSTLRAAPTSANHAPSALQRGAALPQRSSPVGWFGAVARRPGSDRFCNVALAQMPVVFSTILVST